MGHRAGCARPPEPRHLILYDDACGLCSALLKFVSARTVFGVFAFASLHSPEAKAVLAAHGAVADLTTFYVVTNYRAAEAALLSKSDAAIAVAEHLSGGWRWMRLLRWCPRRLRDGAYALVARHRHRLFGRTDQCVPPAASAHPRVSDVANPK